MGSGHSGTMMEPQSTVTKGDGNSTTEPSSSVSWMESFTSICPPEPDIWRTVNISSAVSSSLSASSEIYQWMICELSSSASPMSGGSKPMMANSVLMISSM